MRLKLGRPDLRTTRAISMRPAAGPDAPLTVTWAGVTTLLIDDGASALMTDGFFSRPGLLEVGLRRLSPSAPRIDGCLTRLGVDRLEASAAGAHALRPRDGLGGGRRTHRRTGSRRNVGGAGRPWARPA